ncbi:MAG: dTDP-4-dehydrorhamnose reductase [Nitrospirae bacterium]|nr:MAG: dTDP-4-dehydrorhamnose reductase [Nitrospirota bacterium]
MKIFVAGRHGMLAQELARCLPDAGIDVVCQGRPALDLRAPETLDRAIKSARPDLVINAAAYTAVDQAEADSATAFAVNRDGARALAEICGELDIPLIHISSDYVFDGMATRPYREEDPPAPLGIYGRSKYEGEIAVRSATSQHLILRTAWVYSAYGRNFVKTILRLANEKHELSVVHDQRGCPTWARELAQVLVSICHQLHDRSGLPKWGTYHVCGAGEATWYELAVAVLEEAKSYRTLCAERVVPIPTEAYPTRAPRPRYSVLDCSKIQETFGIYPAPWRVSLQHCMQELCICPPIPLETS